jgi:REP element-mobilizing transposase RayT
MKSGNQALRKGRFSEQGRIYHLVFRTANKELTELERLEVSRVINDSQVLRANVLLAWVVMPDHVHLLVELRDDSLGRLMARVKSTSSLRVNQISNSKGSVWKRAYFDRAIRHEDDVQDVARYIVANPVRAGLVKSVRFYSYGGAVWI